MDRVGHDEMSTPSAAVTASWPGDRALHGGVDEIALPRGPGRLWLCGKRFVGTDPEAALALVGADRIVCLCEPSELAARYPGYVAWLVTEEHGRAICFPIPDLHAPSVDATVPFLDSLRAGLDGGGSLLMHCGAGIGRAGTMAAALLMTMGMERTAAVAAVARSRPLAGPEAGAQSELLVALAGRIAGGRPDPEESSR